MSLDLSLSNYPSSVFSCCMPLSFKEVVEMEDGKFLQAQVFTRAVLHLKDLGFMSDDGKDLPCIYYSPFFLIGVFMKLGLIGNMYQNYDKHSKTEFFNSLVFLISLTFQASVAVMFYLCGNRSAKFLSQMNRFEYGVPKKLLRLVRGFEHMTTAVHNYIVYGYTLFIIMNHKSYSDCSKMKKEVEDSSLYYCGVYTQTWYPVRLDFTPVKEILYIMQVLELTYYIAKVSSTIVFFHGCVVLTEERIADLKRFLRKTKITATNKEEVNARLKWAVKKYVEISETVNAMNSTIGFIFSPLQHVILLGLLVFLEFRIVVSLSLERAVYEFPWYDLDRSSTSLFKIFYRQVQLTLKVKSPPFIVLNMQYYHEVMKGTYSFLMYLKRF